jgi:hypothetical protein
MDQVQPALAVGEGHSVAVSFYDRRLTGNTLLDATIAVSHNEGGSFEHNRRLTPVSWDPSLDAPVPGRVSCGATVTFIGDYFGATSAGDSFIPFWMDTRDGIQEIYAADIGKLPKPVLASLPDEGRVDSDESSGSGSGPRGANTRSGSAQVSFAVLPPRPNPMSQGMVVEFQAMANDRVEAAVFDLTGRLVRSLLPLGPAHAGRNLVSWDGRDERGTAAAAGIYLVRIAEGDRVAQRKFTVLR